MTSEREQSGTRSGSAERESSRPQGKMETEPKPKQEKPKAEQQEKVSSSKFQVSSNGAQPTPETSNVKPETKVGKLTYSTYVNGKGKTCAKISGFAETDAAYQKEAAASLHGSATYENTKQGRVNFLLFGPRYAEVAKTVCQMLNEGKTVADCQAVVDAATEERMAKREERKQKREAYRQEHEGKAQTAKPQGKTYTEAEVADLMRRVIEGDKEAIAIVNAMAA
jgi:DNA-binding transcriptional MerR regulator